MLNFDWLANVSESWGRFFVIMAFIVPFVFAMTLRRAYIYQGAQDLHRWRNLKYWVFFIVAVQVGVYLYF